MGRISLLVLAVFLCASIKADSNVQQAKLHQMMTLEEMKDYLETDTNDIPDYEAIRLSSPRSKRSISPSGKVYSMSAFGRDILLDLTTPSDTISDYGVIVQRRTAEGHYEETHRPDGEFFHGHVTGDDNSKVAVRISEDGKELSGSIFSDGHVYKLQPINKRLRDEANLNGDGHHVISRRKLRKPFLEQLETSNVMNNAKTRERRSADVILTEPRIIELMITIDKTTYDFYGNQSLDYALHVANMVNRFYRDPSMGFDLSVLLTKVFIIQHDEPALDIQTQNIDSAVSFLYKFREWGAKQSALAPPAAPGHFDNAALLTRRICGLKHCAVDGVAFSGYPCNTNLGFSLNEARGLQAAFSVAHEMAHNIGLSHDKGECKKGFMMNAAQASGPNSFRWSPCSSKKMKEIMSRETCYSDKPAKTYTMPTRYPGYVYNADTQCKMAYDSTYSICPVTKNSCSQLFCKKGGGCVGKGAAPLDGTPCGQRKWCLRGNCVDIGNDLPPAIDGQWGSWSHHTHCTRPCGGGVRYRKRYCDNPRPQYTGKACVGPSVGHEEICNPQECTTKVDLRLETCTKHGIKRTYYKASSPCTLYCRTGSIVQVYGNVIDGTRCLLDEDIKDTCIKGRCRKVGCDSVLESGNEIDRCRKCGGNGGDCKLVKLPHYTKDYRVYGLGKPDVMFTIPTGAMNVRIQEFSKTNNMISVKLSPSSSSPYLVRVPSYTSKTEAAGTVIEHRMKSITDDETILIRGPTTAPLYAVFVYVGFVRNPGFSCEYFVPGKSKATKYAWKVTKGDHCNAKCAGGIRTNHVTCHRVDDDTAVGTKYCDQATKPATREPCNTQPCNPEWVSGDWMVCSKSCSGGQQTRSVICQQKTSYNTTITLKDSQCDQNNHPATLQNCNQRNCPPEWKNTPWSKCSVQCGGGSRTRSVSCKQTLLNQSSISLAESNCMTEIGYKPTNTEKCNTMDCYVWSKDYPCDGCRGYRHLGCYRDTKDRALPKLIKTNLPSKNTVHECYKAVKALGYDMFAVQNQVECWASAAGKPTYNKHGSSSSCKDGTGGPWANNVYQIVSNKSFQQVGCFKDRHRPDRRPLPRLLSNHRNNIDWKNINKTIVKCSLDAWDDGLPVFGVQYYGECWSGDFGYESYDIDGVSINGCWKGVGGSGANFVYAFTSKVIKTNITCRHIISHAIESDDHCKGSKPDNDLRLCKQLCKN